MMRKVKTIELTEKEQEVFAIVQQAGFYLSTYQTIESLDLLNKAEGMCGPDIRPFVRVAVFKNKSRALWIMKDNDGALEYLKKAQSLMDSDNDKAANAGEIADYYLRLGRLDDAEEYADLAISFNPDKILWFKPFQVKGDVAFLRKDYPKALELLNEGAQAAEETHAVCDLAMIIMDISEVFRAMGKLEIAYGEMFRAERYVKESGNLDLYSRLAVRRAALLYCMGRDAEAKSVIMALSEQRN